MSRLPFIVALAAASSLNAQGAAPVATTTDPLAALAFRSVGPAITSGRIADVAIDPRNRSTWYVASASGGLWKTTNRGLTFQPIFDEGGSYSLGCVTVDQKNPD